MSGVSVHLWRLGWGSRGAGPSPKWLRRCCSNMFKSLVAMSTQCRAAYFNLKSNWPVDGAPESVRAAGSSLGVRRLLFVLRAVVFLDELACPASLSSTSSNLTLRSPAGCTLTPSTASYNTQFHSSRWLSAWHSLLSLSSGVSSSVPVRNAVARPEAGWLAVTSPPPRCAFP